MIPLKFAILATFVAAQAMAECVPQWTKSKPFPEPTSDYAAGFLDGTLVIAGGAYWEGSKGHWVKKQFSAMTQAFNPRSQIWMKLPDLPEPLAGGGSAVIGNRLFVAGGYTGHEISHDVLTLRKDGARYVWHKFCKIPQDRVFGAAVAVGSKLYLLGGLTRFEPIDPTGTCCTSRTGVDSVLVLDVDHPASGWSEVTHLPGPRRWFFRAAALGQDIWIFGGRYQDTGQGPILNFSNLVFRYNVATGQWESMKPLPRLSPTADPVSPVVVRNKMILITNEKLVWQLDPKTSNYRDLPLLPEAVLLDRFVWTGRQIIGAGGENTLEEPRRRSDRTFVGTCSSSEFPR